MLPQFLIFNGSSPGFFRAMNRKDPKLIALQFNECINNRDLDGLARLMTEDHTFLDRDGKVGRPRHVMLNGWREFFHMFPTYKNTFDCVQSKENLVMILGRAFWSDEQPYDPVIWIATIVDDLVGEWRIYADTEDNRRRFDFL
jgi:hypothetical protein